jgi:tetratricopeptide (TPR) repeat protein
MSSIMPFIVIAGIYLTIYLCNPIITLFHELGHALAYLVFTKPHQIDVYIGSYGNTKQSYSFKAGKLRFYVKYSFPFTRRGGLCKSYRQEDNYIYKAIILLAGPAFSLIIAVALSYIAFNFDLHGSIKMFCIILVILSGIGFITNIAPRTINLKDGTILYTDGKQLLFTLRARKVFKMYISVYKHLENEKFDLAIQTLKHVLTVVPDDEHILRLIIPILIQEKEYKEALGYFTTFKKKCILEANDYLTLGTLQSLNNQSEDAIKNYKIVLKLNKDQSVAMSNLAYEFIRQGNYQSATIILERTITLYTDFSYAYSNLGYCKILQDDLENGKELIDKSIELNSEDAYAYKHLGVYYFKKGNADQAFCYFNKALAIDKTIDLTPYLDDALLLTKNPANTQI